MGQEEGAEPNSGHAAAPTALCGLKITVFTLSQSRESCPPVRGVRDFTVAAFPTARLLLQPGEAWANRQAPAFWACSPGLFFVEGGEETLNKLVTPCRKSSLLEDSSSSQGAGAEGPRCHAAAGSWLEAQLAV